VSFQITILKVLAGQAEGRAALPELTRQVSILISSGPDWTDRTKRLAALAPGLDIFRSSFVLVDRANWQITDAGRAFLISLETPTSADNYSAITEDVILPDATPPAYNDEPKLEVTAPMPSSRLMRLIKIHCALIECGDLAKFASKDRRLPAHRGKRQLEPLPS
jgi:hypothetical protein